MDGLLSLLIFVVILAIVVWICLYIISLLPLPGPFNKIATVLILLIALIFLLQRALPLLQI